MTRLERNIRPSEEKVHALDRKLEVKIRRLKTNILPRGEHRIHQGSEVKAEVLKAKRRILRVIVNPPREKGEGHALGL